MGRLVYDDIRKVPVRLEGRVAIKLHMGERGNPNHIPPGDVGILVDKIKENGGEPFLFDTTTLYKKGRFTRKGYEELARKHGFGRFEVVIASDDEFRVVDGFRVARPVAEANSMLLLSHVTGHLLTGIGGAVKNLAMGCVVRDGKRRIHAPMRPVHNEMSCIRCGACVNACPYGLLSMSGSLRLSLDDCPACGRCIESCPTGAMRRRPGSDIMSFRQFALSAKAVLSLFGRGDLLCVNSMKKITRYCDCSSPSRLVCKDMGYLAGPDPLALDLEAARLLRGKGARLDWKTWEKFARIASAVMQRK
jgi:uncharacterized Fe-S center protein